MVYARPPVAAPHPASVDPGQGRTRSFCYSLPLCAMLANWILYLVQGAAASVVDDIR